MPDPTSATRRNGDRTQFLQVCAEVCLWTVTRLLMLRVFSLPNANFITGDVSYYRWWLTASHLPDSQILMEYPVPVVWGMRLLLWASGGQGGTYFMPLFAVTMLGLDALMTLALWRRNHRCGALWWTLFVPALGPLMWFRFDMVPAVCMGLAGLWYRRHPAACGAAIAVGASIKLWPALLILPMIGRRPAALRRLLSFAITGVGLALASLIATDWPRLTSPLTWQSDRGLQIEAVTATWPMTVHAAGLSEGYEVGFSKFNAFEITGASVPGWLLASTVLMVGAVALAVVLGVIAWQRNGLDQRTVVLATVTIVGALIVANKTLSPQYFVWWGATVAVLLDAFSAETTAGTTGTSPAPAGPPTLTWAIAGSLLALAALTQCVYPFAYGNILQQTPVMWTVMLLAGRNILAVVTLGLCGAALNRSLAKHRTPVPTTAR